MIDLRNMNLDELAAWIADQGEKPFRAKQIFQWLWAKNAAGFDEMTNIARPLREKLASIAHLSRPVVVDTAVSRDGTVKLLLGLEDGQSVETVLIPEKEHTTQCLSTQVGCAMGCAFCSTGDMGLARNMSMAEICGQILTAHAWRAENDPDAEKARPLRNFVFMGMGEPFANTREVMRSLETMTHELGLLVSPRRITVSTCGIPKGIAALGESGLASLAVSLHAPTQELREKLMPVAAKVPLDELMEALKAYPLKNRERITFEYILLGGVNDSVEHARELVRLVSHVKCKINLIAYNAPKDVDAPFQPPRMEDVLAFEQTLRDKNLTVILRRSKGADIAAACGQLKALRTE